MVIASQLNLLKKKENILEDASVFNGYRVCHKSRHIMKLYERQLD
jgi:hypothetical protein